jgi:hypothetical protein
MTTVTVSPPVVNVCDILEYARALIEEHGWRQGPRVPENEDWPEVAKNGLSLHDAIGMACYRLSGETGATRRGSRAYNSKDFPTKYGSLRADTTTAVTKHILGGKDDVRFNDAAKDVDEVLAVLNAAIGEECK